MNASPALPFALPVRLRPVSVGSMAGLALASVALAPPLLGGFVLMDWSDTVEAAVVGLLEASVVGLWASRGGRLPQGSAQGSARWVPVVVAAWLAAMALATAAAVDVAPAVVRTAAWVAHVAFAAVVWAEAQRDPAAVRAVERGAAGGFVAAAVLGTAVWAWDALVGGTLDWSYHVPFVGGVRWAGVYGLAGVFFAVRGLVSAEDRGQGAVAFAAAAVGWAALMWSASRGALGGAVVASAFVVWCAPSRMRATVALAASAVAGAALSLVVAVDVPGVGLWRFFEASPTGVAAFTSGRTVLWEIAVEAWQRHPVLGLGPGSTVSLLSPVGNAHVHNAVLQALVEWGLVGTLPFVALAAGLLWRAVAVGRGAHREVSPAVDVRLGAAAYLVATAAAAMLDGLTSDPATTALMAGASALVLLPNASTCRPPRRSVGSVWWSRGVVVSALAAAVVLAAHLVLLRAVWMPGVPPPDSFRARAVLAAPTYPFAKEIEGWGRSWMPTDPAAADRVARWGLAVGRSPWLFLRLRGDLALRRGDAAAAEADYRRAAVLYARAVAPLVRFRAETPSGGDAVPASRNAGD